MAGLKKKRRIQMIVIGMVLLATSSALIGYAMRDGIEFFRSPTQITENRPGPNERFRIGGLVEVDSLVRGEGKEITFRVTDGNAAINVSFTGILPDLFGEGQGMVATGKLINDTFVATEILAKHDENYMPKEVIDALKEQGNYVEPDET
ncbi:MAG: cytochrome c maturation protein CcmE [Paracoccaceae bacterium]